MEEFNVDNLKKLAGSLQRLTECPVCLGGLRSPVSLCANGHAVCPTCRSLLKECPLCRAPYTADRSSLTLNQILDVLPRRCRYETAGCRELFCPGENHEEFCSYRPTPCRVPTCDWRGPVSRLRGHLHQAHSPPHVILGGEEFHFTYPSFDPLNEFISFTPLVVYDELLWQVTKLDKTKHKLFITFYRLLMSNPNNMLFATVSMEKGGLSYRYSIQVSNKDEGDEDISCMDYVMAVPQAVLPLLVDPTLSLVASLRVDKF